MQPIVVAAPNLLALREGRRGIFGAGLSKIGSVSSAVGLLEEVVAQHLHLDLDVAAGQVEDGALRHDGHGVLLLGVLGGLGLAFHLRSGIGNWFNVLNN